MLNRSIIAIIILMNLFYGVCYGGTVKVELVTSRGSLTNQVEVSTQTLLSIEDSEFYTTEIKVTPFDMVIAVQDCTNYYKQIDYSFTTTEGKRATLVAPNIAVSCEHWHHQVGEKMIFGAYTAVVVNVAYDTIYGEDGTPIIMSDGTTGVYDYCFMELDRDLPIKPCTLAPINFQSYFDLGGWSWYSNHVPFTVLKQNGVPVCVNIYQVREFGGGWGSALGLYIGDSGDPVFVIVEGNPVLIGVITSVKGFHCIHADLMPVNRGWGL
jgi:hypothetical protein